MITSSDFINFLYSIDSHIVRGYMPVSYTHLDVYKRQGLNEQYEEYAIHDTDNFPIDIGEYVSIEELNEMYELSLIHI